MRILYDISTLGPAYYSQRTRGGIARVIENLALELQKVHSIELYFCASRSLPLYVQTLKYINAGKLGADIQCCQPEMSLVGKVVVDFLYKYFKPSPYERVTKISTMLLNIFNFSITVPNKADLNNADIFHATHYPFPRYVSSSSKLRRIITIYDLIPILYPQHFNLNVVHLTHNVVHSIKENDWVIAISQSTKKDLCGYLHMDPSRVFVVPLAASDIFYKCENKASIENVKQKYQIPEGPYVLSLSKLEPRKNIDQVIRCFIRLIQEEAIDDLNLVLAGAKGWNFDKIFREIDNASRFKDRIVVTGYVPDEELAPLYSGAIMFVYPSLYEGFGLPPLEAMQCGVPVITSNTSSLPEVVGDAGIMIEPQDSAGLCQAMLDIYNKPLMREELAAKSLTRSSWFSWKKSAEKTVDAYKTAVEN